MNAAEIICRAFKAPLIYEPAFDYETWAEKFMQFEGHRFRFRPYQRQPARDIFNPKIQDLSMQACTGFGKTIIVAGAFAYAIEQLALRIGLMYPSAETSKERLRDKFFPIIEKTRRVADLPFRKGLRGDINLAYDKQWANGGRLQATGAGSYDKIRTMEIEMGYADEIDSNPMSVSDEGDAVDALFARTRDQNTQIHIATSYPGRKGFSAIQAMTDQSDCCQWHVPCWHCGEWYVMHTKQMRWTEGDPATAELVCPECDGAINDDQRRQMSEAGDYCDRHGNWLSEAENGIPDGFKGHRGYFVNCMVHLGTHASWANGYLHEIAAMKDKIPHSKHPAKAERVFVNTRDAEPYAEPVEEKPEADLMYFKREKYNPREMLPAGVLCLVMATDVQGNRLEYEIVGGGKNGETWGCGYGIVWGSPLLQSTWNKLFRIQSKGLPHPSGQQMPVAIHMVDSAHWQNDVFKFCRGQPRVHCVKGSKTHGTPILGKGRKVGDPKTTQIPIGTNEAKAEIYRRSLLQYDEESGVFPYGYQHFPATEEYGPNAGGEGTGYFEMLLAEEGILKETPSGDFEPAFTNESNRRNEALDIRVYAAAGFKKLRPNYDKLAEKYSLETAGTAAEKKKSVSTRPKKRNFATTW